MTILGNLMFQMKKGNLNIPNYCSCRYPFDEAALIGISTIKEFANDFKDSDFLRVKTTVETRRANEMHGLFRLQNSQPF